ncbi:hypothetical protein GCM10009609_36860 [Pseudonocardia aurantiaca]
MPSSDATPHPVGVRRIRCDHATHVRLPAEAAGYAAGYTVAVPLNGAVEVTYRTGTLGADSGRAVVFRPETDITVTHPIPVTTIATATSGTARVAPVTSTAAAYASVDAATTTPGPTRVRTMGTTSAPSTAPTPAPPSSSP